MDATTITTLEPREKPTAAQIIDELREAIIAASGMGVFERLERCHKTRRCMWNGKTDDGRLPRGSLDQERLVFRWPGAPDISVPLCDKIVRWLSMKRMSVLSRGDMRLAPRRVGKQDEDQHPQDMAATWQATMEYFTTVQDWNLAKHFELFGTCVEEFGYGVIMADWVKKQRIELIKVTIQQITDALLNKARTAILEQAGPDADPAQVMTPEIEQQLVQTVQMELEMMLAMTGQVDDGHVELMQMMDPRMSEQEARKVIAALRKSPGEPAEYFAPRDDGGTFEVEALVPWVNVLHSHDLTGDGRCDFFAVPRYWSESKVRERARSEKWDKTATADLIENQKNKFFTELYQTTNLSGVAEWALNGSGIGLIPDMVAMEKMPRWLVIYVWRRVVTKEGRPMIYRGVVHPNMAERMLLWEATDLEELPFVVDTSEAVTYAMAAHGVADVVIDKQNYIKDTFDSEGARGQLGSNPPLLRTIDQNTKLYPGVQLYTKRSGTSFLGSTFMDVPQIDKGSVELVARVSQMVDEFYFRGETTSPEDQRMFHEWVTFKSLRAYKELIRLLWRLIQENIEVLQISRINGRDVSVNVTRDQLQGEVDITIGVHLDGYGEDAADKFIDVLGKMIQADRAGTVDWSEAMNITAQLLSPTYARRLVMTPQAAQGKSIDDQELRIAKIMAGVPVRYEENTSNPQLRMQVLEQWAQMPGNIQRAQTDPLVAEMMQKEQDMLKFQNAQQSTNPQAGRTGVKENQPENLG